MDCGNDCPVEQNIFISEYYSLRTFSKLRIETPVEKAKSDECLPNLTVCPIQICRMHLWIYFNVSTTQMQRINWLGIYPDGISTKVNPDIIFLRPENYLPYNGPLLNKWFEFL